MAVEILTKSTWTLNKEFTTKKNLIYGCFFKNKRHILIYEILLFTFMLNIENILIINKKKSRLPTIYYIGIYVLVYHIRQTSSMEFT